MGCDIHGIIQYKRADDKHWKTWCKSLPVNRNYELFTLLANVRSTGDIDPIYFPKGLPKDLDLPEDITEDNLGEHSFSWLSLSEISKIATNLDLRKTLYPGTVSAIDTLFYLMCAAADYNKTNKARIVFGFDS